MSPIHATYPQPVSSELHVEYVRALSICAGIVSVEERGIRSGISFPARFVLLGLKSVYGCRDAMDSTPCQTFPVRDQSRGPHRLASSMQRSKIDVVSAGSLLEVVNKQFQ